MVLQKLLILTGLSMKVKLLIGSPMVLENLNEQTETFLFDVLNSSTVDLKDYQNWNELMVLGLRYSSKEKDNILALMIMTYRLLAFMITQIGIPLMMNLNLKRPIALN